MKTPKLPWALALGASTLAIAGATTLHSAPSYEAGRLVFTVGGSGTTVWLNTPTTALTAPVSKDALDQLTPVFVAIQATAPDVSYPSGVPIDDMMLVNWMSLARWNLVTVTQNQVDIGVTTSYYFTRAR